MAENNVTLVPFAKRTRREKRKSPIGIKWKDACINAYDNTSLGIITSPSKTPTALMRLLSSTSKLGNSDANSFMGPTI